MNKKKLLAVCAVLCVILVAAAFFLTEKGSHSASGEVIIYHTNDTHGYISGDGESTIGIEMVAGLKDSTPGSILIDAGDATQGLPLASLTKGADVIELMNLAGLI